MSKRRYKRKFKTTFENGGFLEYYNNLEKQFQDFLEYVPYLDKNESVISFKLANLLLNIGGYIDSAFKEMVFYRKFSKNSDCREIRKKVTEARKRTKTGLAPITIKIEDFLNFFEPVYNLSKQEIIFKRIPEREIILPFHPQKSSRIVPKWWDVHNHVKHDFKENFEKATLRTTRDALAGAYLLTAVHYPSVYRIYDYAVIKKENQVTRMGFQNIAMPLLNLISIYEHQGLGLPFKWETEIFQIK